MEASHTHVINLKAVVGNEQAVQDLLTEALSQTQCPPKVCKELHLATEELFVNVARYAYVPDVGDIEVSIYIAQDGQGARVVLRDTGVAFNPFMHRDPQAPPSIEQAAIGGLGILMVKRLMDSCTYQRVDGYNEVSIEKRW